MKKDGFKSKRSMQYWKLATGLCMMLCLALWVVGCEGPTGDQGPKGDNGNNGADGTTGPTGPSGENGQDGQNGDDGQQGDPGPTGDDGEPGENGCDQGNVAGTVKDEAGTPLPNVIISTDPASTPTTTDTSGVFTLSNLNIGVYKLMAALEGFQTATMEVGIVACQTVNVSILLVENPPSGPATISGSVTDALGNGLSGAVVIAEGTELSTTTGEDGDFSLSGLTPPGPYYLYVTAPSGYLDGEIKASIWVSPGQVLSIGEPIRLSGRPSDNATYVGSEGCATVGCHGGGLATAWQNSVHNHSIQHDDSTLLTDAWPVVGDRLVLPFQANIYGSISQQAEVVLLHPSDNFYQVRVGEDVFDVTGTYGGVSTALYKQRYFFNDNKTTNPMDPTSTDGEFPVKILPIQYNQKSQTWVSYQPSDWWSDSRTFAKKCAGCHNTGLSLDLNPDNGVVSKYTYSNLNTGCEKCHGPGSEHQLAPTPEEKVKAIINPGYLTAKAEIEVCGQCHARGSSVEPANGYDFPWQESATTVGHGAFVAGIDSALEDFFVYKPGLWSDPVGHSKQHHQQYNDEMKSKHINNPFQKVTCMDCHSPHSAANSPNTAERNNYIYTRPDYTNNVSCLSCHATHGDFTEISKADVAAVHVGSGGTLTDLEGNPVTFTDEEIALAKESLSEHVQGHMIGRAAMPAMYDPENGVGRCTTCHMPKTARSADYFYGPDDNGNSALVEADIASHVFDIIWPQTSRAMLETAATDNDIIPNSCGGCHDNYRFSAN